LLSGLLLEFVRQRRLFGTIFNQIDLNTNIYATGYILFCTSAPLAVRIIAVGNKQTVFDNT